VSSHQGSTPKIPRNFSVLDTHLRVTVEWAFIALKKRFRILDQKSFHIFSTHVKLVLACCIPHNWILGWGLDEFSQEENAVMPHEVDDGHAISATDNELRRNKRHEWTNDMWANRGDTGI
jgi:hypothetical protein